MKSIIKLISIIFGFCLFGIGGIFLGAIVLPLLSFFYPVEKRWLFYQKNIQHIFSWFVTILVKLKIFKLEIKGLAELQQIQSGELIVANHPSLMDVVFLISILPEVTCIVKSSLWNNPFMMFAVRGAKYIKNDDAENFVEQCTSILKKENKSILIFPEGTRTLKENKVNRFRRGFANIVYNSQDIPIRPIVINITPRFLCKTDKWYNTPQSIVKVEIDIGKKQNVGNWYDMQDTRSIAVRKINHKMYQYFLKRIN